MTTYDRVVSPTLHLTVAFAIFCFCAVVTLTVIIKIEIVARGYGKIEPVELVQSIQTAFGGQVTHIHARVGDFIEAGAPLVSLDTTIVSRDLAEVDAALNRIKWRLSRLTALKQAIETDELASAPTIFKDNLSQLQLEAKHDVDEFTLHEELLDAEVEDWSALLKQIELHNDIYLQNKRATQLEIQRIERLVESTEQRRANAHNLHQSGLVSDLQLAETTREKSDASNRLAIAQTELIKLTVSAEENKAALSRERAAKYQRLSETIETLRSELNENERLRVIALRALQSADVQTPVAGVLERLDITGIGTVLSAGQHFASIVPSDSKLVMRVSFANSEVGFLQEGQKALIGLEAYPSERFGMLAGQLSRIAQDASKNEQDEWGFEADISLEGSIGTTEGKSLPVKVGMTGRVDVVTGQRQLISYFFAPIVDVVNQALGER